MDDFFRRTDVAEEDYEELGATGSTSPDEVHRRYRELARIYHSLADEGSPLKFQRIEQAHTRIRAAGRCKCSGKSATTPMSEPAPTPDATSQPEPEPSPWQDAETFEAEESTPPPRPNPPPRTHPAPRPSPPPRRNPPTPTRSPTRAPGVAFGGLEAILGAIFVLADVAGTALVLPGIPALGLLPQTTRTFDAVALGIGLGCPLLHLLLSGLRSGLATGLGSNGYRLFPVGAHPLLVARRAGDKCGPFSRTHAEGLLC